VKRRRRLWQGCEIRRLGDRQLVDRLVEIYQRRRGNPVSPEAKRDLVEIQFEYLVLRISALETYRQQGFLDLAGEGHLVGQKKVLGDLLGDGRSALRPPARPEVLRIQKRCARHSRISDAAMFVEILVLGGQERIDDQLRNRLYRQIQPPFPGVFRKQRPVRRLHPRGHRRLIILKLRIVRQVLGKMPDQPRRGGDTNQ